jgi:LPPG:FO 2-phospho-L-lactate transferase
LAHGLALRLPAEDLVVVVNTGDDFQHLGLSISPDLDTVMYTLAGLANAETGWGLAGESWNFLAALEQLGGETWFRLGDRDLATHVERTRRLRAGETLTAVTGALCAALKTGARVLPMTDDRLRTLVDSDEGRLAFQEYFVHRQCRPRVSGFVFEGAARATPAVVGALEQADLIVICPSNPFVSIGPILALPGVREILAARPVAAVTPIVGGLAIKGPAAKMLAELGLEVSPVAVARYYEGLLNYFVLDQVDEGLAGELATGGLEVMVTDTIMRSDANRARLAQAVLELAGGG